MEAMETTLVHRCVRQVVDALFCAFYSSSDSDAAATKVTSPSSVCASGDSSGSSSDDETLAAMRDVLHSLQPIANRFYDFAWRPTDLRVHLSRELQRRWKSHVQELKVTKSHWWRAVAEPSETEALLWTALTAWNDEAQEFQVNSFPPWFLSSSYTQQHTSAINLDMLSFNGVDWYEDPEELSHALSQLSLTNLRRLTLQSEAIVHDEHLALIVTLAPQLETLNISHCSQVTDAGVQLVLQAYSPTLKTFWCNGLRRLTHNSIQGLGACEKLRKLELEGCLGIDQLPALEPNPPLTHVNLQSLCRVSDRGLKAFLAPHWGRLKGLKLGEAEISTASLVELTLQLLPPYALLRELDLSWCSRCEVPGLGAIFEKMPLLTTLKLRSLRIQDGVLRGLSSASCFANLQLLDLERCSRLTEQGFAALVANDKAVGSLRRINVSWTSISSALLGKLLVKNAKTMRSVRLEGCQHVDHTILRIFDENREEDLSPEPSPETKALNRNQQWPHLECFDSKWVDEIRDRHIFAAAKCVPGVKFIGYYGEKTTFKYNGHQIEE